MLTRSVCGPLIIGIGTGVVLAGGTASAALAAATPSPSVSASQTSSATPTPTPTPTPKPTPTPTPKPTPTLKLAFANLPSASHPGTSSTFDVVVTPQGGAVSNFELTLASDRGSKPTFANTTRTYTVKKLSAARHIAVTVAIPTKVKSGKVKVTAYAAGDELAKAMSAAQSFTVTKPKSSSSGSSGGSSTSSGSTSSTPSLPTGSTATTPSGGAGAATTPSDSAVLPSLAAPQQTPSTAPNATVVQNAGSSQSMRGTPVADDELTFDKLASTQAAWLAALLVAFSLLLTQIRLGRTAARSPKHKGAHRRVRRSSAH